MKKKNYIIPEFWPVGFQTGNVLCASNGTTESYSAQENISDEFNWE